MAIINPVYVVLAVKPILSRDLIFLAPVRWFLLLRFLLLVVLLLQVKLLKYDQNYPTQFTFPLSYKPPYPEMIEVLDG